MLPLLLASALCSAVQAQNQTATKALADGSKIIFQGGSGPVTLNQCNSACESFNVVLFNTCGSQQADYRRQMQCGCSTSLVAQAQLCGSCCQQLGYAAQFETVFQVVEDCQIIIDKGNTSSVAAEIPYKTVTSIQTILHEKTHTQRWTEFATRTQTNYATQTQIQTETQLWTQFHTASPVYTQTVITSVYSTWTTLDHSSMQVPCTTTWTSAWFSTPGHPSRTQSTSLQPTSWEVPSTTSWSADLPAFTKTSESWPASSPTIFVSAAQVLLTSPAQLWVAFGAIGLIFTMSCVLL